MELYTLARARGLRFCLIGPGRIRVDGDRRTVALLNDELERFAPDLVALVQEYADPLPVTAAISVLRNALGPGADFALPYGVDVQIGSNRRMPA